MKREDKIREENKQISSILNRLFEKIKSTKKEKESDNKEIEENNN